MQQIRHENKKMLRRYIRKVVSFFKEMSLTLWGSEILVASVISEDLEWAEDLSKSTGRTADLWCGEGEASNKCRRHGGRVSVVAMLRIV